MSSFTSLFDRKKGKKGKKKGEEVLLCGQCGKEIKVEEGFSGRYFFPPHHQNQRPCHEECLEAYLVPISDKCKECGRPVANVPGAFSGEFVLDDKSKIHNECWEAFVKAGKATSAVQCAACREYMTGDYVEYEEESEANEGEEETQKPKVLKVHEACYLKIGEDEKPPAASSVT